MGVVYHLPASDLLGTTAAVVVRKYPSPVVVRTGESGPRTHNEWNRRCPTNRCATLHSQSYGTQDRAFVWMYSRCLRSCRLMGAFISSPLPPVLAPASCAARPPRSADVTSLHRYWNSCHAALSASLC